MNPHHQAWSKLVSAARHAPAAGDETVPFGFATRVAALGLAAPRPTMAALLEKFALRGFVAAAACSLAAAAFGYTAWSSEQEYESATGDLVSEVLAQS